jgi:hypothetical protein
MKRQRLFTLALTMLLVLVSTFAGTVSSPVHAASNGSISIQGDEYEYSFFADEDDDFGDDLVAVLCINSDGAVSDVDIHEGSITGPESDDSECDDVSGDIDLAAPLPPLSVELWDIGVPPFDEDDANSQLAANWVRSTGQLLASDSEATVTKPICFTDARLNKCDAGQTAAVYCEKGTLIVYAIYNGKGYLAFKMTKEELDRFPANPERNILIKQIMGVRLYRLSSGELQINRAQNEGQDYVFRWQGC